MTQGPIVDALFVAYENQENLGVRYVMAYLEAHGYRTELAAFDRQHPDRLIERAKALRPRLIGFSIIFQYTLEEFGTVMDALRRHGVTAHFTAGGHYPSLRPVETLDALPALDTVVRFEGELTALELIAECEHPSSWPAIAGLAFRQGGHIVITAPRPLVANLDDLPWPRRNGFHQTTRGIPAAPILASRGCCFDCHFCSIREFYRGAPGPARRSRSPEHVVDEMRALYDDGVRLFLFQDDDFAAKTNEQRRWLQRFLRSLDERGLRREIGWKISCRVDDIDAEVMAACRDHGLLVVYLGVESGSADGLATLNKRVTVEQNLTAMETLKAVGLEFDMGFMLFDPDSSFMRIRQNVAFLRRVAALGGPPISFVKMLPLAGTVIERRLRLEGRLTGTELRPDYDLLDPRLDHYALFVTLNFSTRNSDPAGLVERLRLAYFDRLVAERFAGDSGAAAYGEALRGLIDSANAIALETLETALHLVEALPPTRESVPLAWPQLARIAAREHVEEERIMAELDDVLARYSPGLRRALQEHHTVGLSENDELATSAHASA